MEEQQIKALGNRTGGDGSDAEASATFIHLVRTLIVKERGTNLELLSALPGTWLVPGARIEINRGLTEFGPITIRLFIANDGKRGSLKVSPVDGRGSTGEIRVNLRSLRKKGFVYSDGRPLPDILEQPWGDEIVIRFSR